jgi:hypothetical protein
MIEDEGKTHHVVAKYQTFGTPVPKDEEVESPNEPSVIRVYHQLEGCKLFSEEGDFYNFNSLMNQKRDYWTSDDTHNIFFNFCDKHIDLSRCKNIDLKKNPTFAVRTPLHDPYHCEALTADKAVITYVTEFDM